MKFTVDRSRWRSGGSGRGDVMLLNSQGYMCCLGFVCEQMGVGRQFMESIEAPGDLPIGYRVSLLVDDIGHDNDFCLSAMECNDLNGIPQPDRERELTDLFADHGHELVFTGDYPEGGKQ